ncbi:MAG: hypothetical protein NXI24_10590 [bacterium]|nr:hypothetical protein [bacterium]
MARYKIPGDSPIRRPIADFVQVNAWEIGIDDSTAVCDARATFQGNQIRIIALKDSCDGLSQITAATRVSYSTHYDTGEPEAHYDDLPDGWND